MSGNNDSRLLRVLKRFAILEALIIGLLFGFRGLLPLIDWKILAAGFVEQYWLRSSCLEKH